MPMRDLFLVDGSVGIEILDWLIESNRENLWKVIHLNRKDIIGKCESVGVPHSSWQEFIELTACEESYDRGFCIWWPHILNKKQIEQPRYGFFNLHPSLLPFQRGKGTSFWNLVEETPFGVTIHRISEEVDSGEIVAQRQIPKSWEDTGGSLAKKSQTELIALFKEIYPELSSNRSKSTRVMENSGSFHKLDDLIKKSTLSLEELISVRDLLNLLRAKMHPDFSGCIFEDSGHMYEVQISIRRISQDDN